MQVPIEGRIFLVGCPRSGTTLLQSLLAAHPQVASFPESRFFSTLVVNRPSRRRRLKLALPRARPNFNQFLQEINHEEMQQYLPKFALFIDQYVRAFIRVLDTLTVRQGKRFWIEKTPSHLRRIDYIEKWVPAPKFIHIVRNGADVVASLYEVTQQYPEVWGDWDLDKCIHRWIEDVRISRSQIRKPNHIVVRYEQLVEDPRAVLIELCEFIGIVFNDTMLQDYSAVAKQIVLQREVWKKSVGEAIQSTNSQKFYKLFDEEQRQYILNRLSEANIDKLGTKVQQKGPIA